MECQRIRARGEPRRDQFSSYGFKPTALKNVMKFVRAVVGLAEGTFRWCNLLVPFLLFEPFCTNGEIMTPRTIFGKWDPELGGKFNEVRTHSPILLKHSIVGALVVNIYFVFPLMYIQSSDSPFCTGHYRFWGGCILVGSKMAYPKGVKICMEGFEPIKVERTPIYPRWGILEIF